MIRLNSPDKSPDKKNAIYPVEILHYCGSISPAIFEVNIIRSDGGRMYAILMRCEIIDDTRGTEINNRIAELGRLAEGDAL